ncbi:MAG: ribosome small subunit-dependent GTPase A [Bacillota bacterium]
MDLKALGWTEELSALFKPYEERRMTAARVVLQNKNSYMLYDGQNMVKGRVSGRFLHEVVLKKDYPAVGDWVAVQNIPGSDGVLIHSILPRSTCFVRKLPISGGRKLKNGIIDGGVTEEQVIASNIDTVFIVSGLDDNFNLQRIERYITLAFNSGANPVIILNKLDICPDPALYIDMVRKAAIRLPIHCISAYTGAGMEVFDNYLNSGQTAVFIGSSGVGKSTITNYLLNSEMQKTKTTSSYSGKGRHTTTCRELFFYNNGGMIIDTPGLRELQLWGEEDALADSFEDITELAEKCKYKDCTHAVEPCCAVRNAVEEGKISRERLDSYKKQLEELSRLSKKHRQFEINMNRKRKYSVTGKRDKQ